MKNRVPFCLILSLLAVASCGNLPQEKAILSGIKAPVFRPVDYTPEPGADFRQALNAAIEKCSSEGGGRVVVPAGRHECDGPVVLRSNVELHLEKDAEIAFSSSPEAYLPAVRTFFEGTELYNYSPLVYAVGQENIAITGEGVLNGQASGGFAQFRPQRSAQQDSLRQMGIDGVPVEKRCFGARSILPPNMIQPISCRNILIEGVTILDSPYWIIHPVLCDNVTVRGVKISSYNRNNDGCDPEFTSNVLIEDCTFDCGDDAIAIKAGRDQDGWRVGIPTRNILVRGCRFNSKCNGLCIGSEMSAGVENVVAKDIEIGACHSAIYFKSNLDRGGYIRNVRVSNIVCDTVRTAFVRFETAYHGARGGHHPTTFDNFLVENVRGRASGQCGFYAVGVEDKPLGRIVLKNVCLERTPEPYVLRYAGDVEFRNVTIAGRKMTRRPSETAQSKLRTF